LIELCVAHRRPSLATTTIAWTTLAPMPTIPAKTALSAPANAKIGAGRRLSPRTTGHHNEASERGRVKTMTTRTSLTTASDGGSPDTAVIIEATTRLTIPPTSHYSTAGGIRTTILADDTTGICQATSLSLSVTPEIWGVSWEALLPRW
jgi:hypothetical protein